MAEELGGLTESDKLRSFAETRALSERLAESNAKIFDAEMKGLQLDDARVDLENKKKDQAIKDLEVQDKLNSRRYNIEFSKLAFGKNSSEIEKLASDFMATNPEAAPFMRGIMSNHLKSMSELKVLEGQELEAKKQKDLFDLQTKAEKAKLRFEELNTKSQTNSLKIKEAMDAQKPYDALSELASNLPESMATQMDALYGSLERYKDDPAMKASLVNDAISKYGDLAKATVVNRQLASAFERDHGKKLTLASMLYENITGGKRGKELFNFLRFNPDQRKQLFDTMSKDAKDNPDELESILEMEQDLTSLFEISTKYDKVVETNKGINSLTSEGISAAIRASKDLVSSTNSLLASRETDSKELNSKLNVQKKQLDIQGKEISNQSDARNFAYRTLVEKNNQTSRLYLAKMKEIKDLRDNNNPVPEKLKQEADSLQARMESYMTEMDKLQIQGSEINFDSATPTETNSESTMDDN